MKRSTKLALKTETLRQLTNHDMLAVQGGLNTGYCRTVGGGDEGSGSKPTPERGIIQEFEKIQYGAIKYGP